MKNQNVIKEVSIELNIPIEVVNFAYTSYWRFIKNKIKELPLKENLDEKAFSKLKTNFNIPSLGKLNCTYKRFLGKNKQRINIIKNAKNKKNKTDVHCTSDDNG